MRLGKYFKTPDEVKRYSIEYENWLDTGEYLSSVTFQTISTNTGALSITSDIIRPNTTKVEFFASDGDDGQTYEIAVTMNTTSGQTKQDVIFFSVRAL